MAVTRRGTHPRITRTPQLAALLPEAEQLATAVAGAPEPARQRISDPTSDAVAASLALDGAADDGTSDEGVRARELAGVRAALASDDLAPGLTTEPLAALAQLHRRIVDGLVEPARAGRLRTSAQLVHDASVGRIIHFTPEPEAVPGELDRLARWLTTEGPREHPLVASGVLHLELLRIHPYEVANGRVARAAARLLLRAGGLDPWGLAAPEPALAADPLGYHEEVARTLRRRDLAIWLERWGEAVTDGLRRAARDLGRLPTTVPEPWELFLAGLDAPTFTVRDCLEALELGAPAVHSGLRALLDAGRICRTPGSRGLRYRVVDG